MTLCKLGKLGPYRVNRLMGSLHRKQKILTVATINAPRSYLGDASNGLTVVEINSPSKTQSVNENGSRG